MNLFGASLTQASAPLSDGLASDGLTAIVPRQVASLGAQPPLLDDPIGSLSSRSSTLGPVQAPSTPETVPSQTTVDEILFVDRRVSGYQQLEAGVRPGITVIELNPNQDGIAQISDVLEKFHVRKAIHLVSLGDKGKLQLGAAQFTSRSLKMYSSDLKTWAKSFDPGVDVLIYGSNFGADKKLLQQMSSLTGADVAASLNPTGNTGLGGDWNLEQNVLRVNTGTIATQLAFQPSTLNTYGATFSL
jgi:hypothetical protein